MSTETPRFVAWQRVPPSKTWTKVATGATEAEARAKVFEIPFEGCSRDVCVVREGVDLNRQRRNL